MQIMCGMRGGARIERGTERPNALFATVCGVCCVSGIATTIVPPAGAGACDALWQYRQVVHGCGSSTGCSNACANSSICAATMAAMAKPARSRYWRRVIATTALVPTVAIRDDCNSAIQVPDITATCVCGATFSLSLPADKPA